jgi:hypothetical protein
VAEFRRAVGQRVLRARCSEALAPQAESLLQAVAGFEAQGRGLADGVTVQFGWSVVRLRDLGRELAVYEPDFAGNPLRNWRDDVTCTLVTLASQAIFLNGLPVQPTDFRFDQKLVVRTGCLFEPGLVAHRREPAGPGDSGWYLGPADPGEGEPEAEELESRYVYELLRLRPTVLDVLGLPAGYMVIFNGDQVETVLDPMLREVERVTALSAAPPATSEFIF